MQTDFMMLSNRVRDSVDKCGQVETMLVQEREERRIAVTDIWNKLREVQKEVREAKQLMHRKPQQDAGLLAAPPPPVQSEAIMQNSVEVSRLEKELARWKAQMQQSVQELWTHVRNPATQHHSAASGADIRTIKTDMANLQKMVMELQLNVSMAAIRASRIAMRTTELSEQGKKEAISVLEAKEQAITKQMEASRRERGVTTTYDADAMGLLDVVPPGQSTGQRQIANSGVTLGGQTTTTDLTGALQADEPAT
jgi:hypothetical protein